MLVASTNLERDLGNTEESLCNWIELPGVNSCLFHMEVGHPTSAKTAPYLIALSKDFSVDPLIIGVNSVSNPSASWSDERRASAYETLLDDGMSSGGKGTNGIICRELYFERATMLSNGKALCPSQSDLSGPVSDNN